MHLHNEVINGGKARQLLEDPLFKEAFSKLHENILENWRKCPVKDVELREKLWMMYGMSFSLLDHLRTYMETGKLAEIQLSKQTLKERLFG